MIPFCSDPALYTMVSEGLLVGLSGGYVDDMLRAGSPDFRERLKKTNERFDVGEDEKLPCYFSGFSIARGSEGALEMNQYGYLK